MFREPYARGLAENLRDRLRAAQDSSCANSTAAATAHPSHKDGALPIGA